MNKEMKKKKIKKERSSCDINFVGGEQNGPRQLDKSRHQASDSMLASRKPSSDNLVDQG